MGGGRFGRQGCEKLYGGLYVSTRLFVAGVGIICFVM